ncbi:M48 family peptidase [Duganella sp. BJB488]|uniref:M48 family metallopeptidase n=1 Tax=unclassified Duganella TaxID=2636909 RepID=UPI000E34C954|nr:MULTISPECIES: M48 family metallopeptidase [unclassified Duganella]NVD70406.1 M48 family metallopeptidase [Duganella sp. BJB1802]RFP22709.1 M48 family peptidase [Duganella sp. BJB489]RFP25216.1 M48 family peptidase [Duganella sp. BJB488]RFP33708.1 M48 family peptidase [Duganella sp. BJB480]
MKKLKFNAALLALVCCAGAVAPVAVHAQDDGIPVTSMSRLRGIGGDARQFDQQSKLQYDQMLAQAHQKDAVATDRNPQLIRLRAIAKRLIPFTSRWNPDAANWKWEVNLLNSPTVNAFCMPGGRIAFYNGILVKLNLTDDEVAMVMGHEIAHALREHAREQAGKNTITSVGARIAGALGSAYFGVDPRLGDAAAGMVAQGAALSFSRGDESEADLVGLDLAARAGFDPRAGIALWQKMSAVNKSQPLPFLSTHPSGSKRIEDMEKNMYLVLPVYARAKGLDPDALPPYHSLALPRS